MVKAEENQLSVILLLGNLKERTKMIFLKANFKMSVKNSLTFSTMMNYQIKKSGVQLTKLNACL